jgi:RND family efflux transporter MFP subunit
MKRFFITLTTSAIILSLFVQCSSKDQKAVQTAKVKKGTFHVEVVETGDIYAVQSTNITAPAMSWRFGALKIVKITDDGKELKKGDEAIVFDPSEVQKAIFDANSELEIAKADLQRVQAEQEQKVEELEADLKTANIQYEISGVNLDLASNEAEVDKKKIRLDLEKASISLQKSKEGIINQKKIQNEEINQAKLKIRQLETNLEEAQATLKNLTVLSPANGIAIIKKNWSTKNKWQVGDQTWSGNAMIDLPDMHQLKVVADISEIDISKIKLNQPVEIKLDAYSDSSFTGKVISIASLARSKDEKKQKVKVFPVEIVVNGRSKLLMPGMSASARIIVNNVPNILFIPIDALFKKEEKEFVYVKKGSSYKKKNIKTGLTNNDFVEVKEGLDEGDVLALTDPFQEKVKKGVANQGKANL